MVSMKANYNEKLQKVINCLSGWEYRRLSLLGKIVVLKSLIASQLVYIFYRCQQTMPLYMRLRTCSTALFEVEAGGGQN